MMETEGEVTVGCVQGEIKVMETEGEVTVEGVEGEMKTKG